MVKLEQEQEKIRCSWVSNANELYKSYHDTQWGIPIFDDIKLFEYLVLESAQAGLSWITILNKREHYRKAFFNFDPKKVANMNDQDIENLLKPDSAIVKNRAKIVATIKNAQAFLKIQKEFGSFSKYQWNFVNHKPIVNNYKTVSEIPANTDISTAFAKDLKSRGFSFLGPKTVYAHMQACGMVNDHTTDCFCYKKNA
jgi:DNA-3-methyladenine glycosylase I